MKRQNGFAAILAWALLASTAAQGDVFVGHPVGVGVRAYSLADNYVAVATDLSAVYWNPAALSFLPVREIQVGIDGISQSSNSTLFGNKEGDNLQRLQFTQIGLVHALQTSRGGLTFAAAYQRPMVFDDVFSTSTSYINALNNRVDLSRSDRTFGGLNQWSAAAGLQIAPGTGVGVSAGLVTGTQELSRVFLLKTNGVIAAPDTDDVNESVSRSYLGYDLRFGFMYSLQNRFRLGMRFAVPRVIKFSENLVETHPHSPGTPGHSYEYGGNLVSSYAGAVGAAFIFPFMTVSSEIRFRAPYTLAFPSELIPTGSSAKYYKLGGGLGIEAPLPRTALLARLGYSYDEYDVHQVTVIYDRGQYDWSDDFISVDKNKQLVTAGLGYVTKNVNVELSYGYQFWGITTNQSLQQDYSMSRLMLSFSVRY